MNLKRKLSDFIKMEEGQGNLPRLAGLGVATASSLLVGAVLAQSAAAASCHADAHANEHSDSDPWYWFHSDSYQTVYHDDISWEC